MAATNELYYGRWVFPPGKNAYSDAVLVRSSAPQKIVYQGKEEIVQIPRTPVLDIVAKLHQVRSPSKISIATNDDLRDFLPMLFTLTSSSNDRPKMGTTYYFLTLNHSKAIAGPFVDVFRHQITSVQEAQDALFLPINTESSLIAHTTTGSAVLYPPLRLKTADFAPSLAPESKASRISAALTLNAPFITTEESLLQTIVQTVIDSPSESIRVREIPLQTLDSASLNLSRLIPLLNNGDAGSDPVRRSTWRICAIPPQSLLRPQSSRRPSPSASLEEALTGIELNVFKPSPDYWWCIDVEWDKRQFWRAECFLRGIVDITVPTPTYLYLPSPASREFDGRFSIKLPALWLAFTGAQPWPHVQYPWATRLQGLVSPRLAAISSASTALIKNVSLQILARSNVVIARALVNLLDLNQQSLLTIQDPELRYQEKRRYEDAVNQVQALLAVLASTEEETLLNAEALRKIQDKINRQQVDLANKSSSADPLAQKTLLVLKSVETIIDKIRSEQTTQQTDVAEMVDILYGIEQLFVEYKWLDPESTPGTSWIQSLREKLQSHVRQSEQREQLLKINGELQSNSEQLEQQIIQLEEDKDAQQNSKKALEGTVTEQRRRIEDLTAQLEDQMTQLASYEESESKSSEIIAELQRESKALKVQAALLQTEMTRVEVAAQELKTQVGEEPTVADRDRIQKTLQSITAQRDRLLGIISTMRQTLAKAVKQQVNYANIGTILTTIRTAAAYFATLVTDAKRRTEIKALLDATSNPSLSYRQLASRLTYIYNLIGKSAAAPKSLESERNAVRARARQLELEIDLQRDEVRRLHSLQVRRRRDLITNSLEMRQEPSRIPRLMTLTAVGDDGTQQVNITRKVTFKSRTLDTHVTLPAPFFTATVNEQRPWFTVYAMERDDLSILGNKGRTESDRVDWFVKTVLEAEKSHRSVLTLGIQAQRGLPVFLQIGNRLLGASEATAQQRSLFLSPGTSSVDGQSTRFDGTNWVIANAKSPEPIKPFIVMWSTDSVMESSSRHIDILPRDVFWAQQSTEGLFAIPMEGYFFFRSIDTFLLEHVLAYTIFETTGDNGQPLRNGQVYSVSALIPFSKVVISFLYPAPEERSPLPAIGTQYVYLKQIWIEPMIRRD